MSVVYAQRKLENDPGFFSKLKGKSRLLTSIFSPAVFTPSSSTKYIDFEKGFLIIAQLL